MRWSFAWGFALSAGAWGCSSGALRPVVMRAGQPPRDVEVTTVDGRQIELWGAWVRDGMVLG